MAQTHNPMTLVDWLDDICVRFIVNLPREELESVQRIMFQIEEGHWYYEDFIRPLDPTLPSINLKQFCALIFHHCPLLAGFSHYHAVAYAEFSAYKTRVPVRGAIMLNQDMTKAVLVKGWKKGAKWSFPRGKINKDENDFDCAVREVYEETGYDLRASGIATDEASSHHLEVTLREQQMRLYVFRGVPMDTHFEPLTRKEISKIEWYNISDLPGGKSKKHIGPDDALRHNQFYMVTPFIADLKNWVKQQRKKDRLLPGFAASDPARVEDSGVGTDFEAMAPELAHNDAAEARHFNSLLSRLNKPSLAPQKAGENDETSGQTDELAVQLKRLLSVGGVSETASAVRQSNGSAKPSNANQGMSLLSLLQPNSQYQQPQTPFDQINSSPEAVRTPHHNHPGLPQFHPSGPPPPYGFPQNNGFSHAAPHHVLNEYYPHTQHPPAPLAATNQWPQPDVSQQPNPSFSLNNFNSQSRPVIHEAASRPLQASGAPVGSQAGLNAHSLSLLNAFKSREAPVHADGIVGSISRTSTFPVDQLQSHEALPINAPPFNIPQAEQPQISGLSSAPGAPNPKSLQADTLLSLFNGAHGIKQDNAVGSASRPAELAPPVAELSAGSPRHASFEQSKAPSKKLPMINSALPTQRGTPQLTSATISGPLNAPNFENIARIEPPVELGITPEPTMTPVPVHSVSPGMPLEAPRAMHHPSILDRQNTPAHSTLLSNLPKTGSNQPGMPATFDKRGTMPADQKTALMSLFGKQTVQAVQAASSHQSPLNSMGGIALHRQRMPSQNSPVSPLPSRVAPNKSTSTSLQSISQTIVPLSKSSRVSSIADDTLPPVGLAKSPVTPVEQQNFLLQYLQDVVTNEGRR